MKRESILALFAVIGFVGSARSQGTFQNLDFESARLVFDPELRTTNALPGWAAFSGTDQLFTIPYNFFIGIPTVGLYGSNSSVISGEFSVSLYNDGSISQNGLVPADAASLLLKVRNNDSFSLVVSLAGQSLPYIAISNGPNYTLYGADVSGFGGQAVALTLQSAREVFLDDIEFSPQAIPEPSTLVFCCLGAFFAASHLRHRRFRCPSSGTTSQERV
jgi:hypothetical protein